MVIKLLATFALCTMPYFSLMAEIKPEINVCNRMKVTAWVARGYLPNSASEVKTEGWFEVIPGVSRNIAWEGAAAGDGVYFYANYNNVTGEKYFSETSGETRLCINIGKAFNFDNAATRACSDTHNSMKKFRYYTIPSDGRINLLLTEAAFVRRPSQVQVCNTLSIAIWAARGYQVNNVAEPTTKGWSNLKPGECRDFLWDDAAIGSSFYVYAEYTSEDHFKTELSGDTLLCLNSADAFTLDHAASRSCDQPHNDLKKFRRFTIPANGRIDVALKAADFIKKPALLLACNKMNLPLFLAKGYQSLNDAGPTTEGWYEIKVGACQNLAWPDVGIGDTLFLYAYYKGAGNIVRATLGDTDLCMHKTATFTLENAASGTCNAPFSMTKFRRYTIPADGKVIVEFKETDFNGAL